MAITFTVRDDADHGATLSKYEIARVGEAGEVMTVVVPAGVYALGSVAYMDFITPDGLSYYKGPYDCSSGTFDVTLGVTDSILNLDGILTIQFRLINGTAIVWLSEEKPAKINGSISPVTPATANDFIYAQVPTAFTSGHIAGYNPTTHKLTDLGMLSSTLVSSMVNIKDYGAVGDGSTDDTASILAAIVAANAYDALYIPQGTYKVTSTIQVTKQINFISYGDFKFYGTRDQACFHFVRPIGRIISFYGKVIDQGTAWHGWTDEDYTGIIFENAFRCKIFIKEVTNFTVGVRCLTSGGINNGFFFNTFDILQLNDNKIGLEIYQKDVGSWFNSNVFNDMFFSLTQTGTEFQTAVVDRYCIKQTMDTNTYQSDSNLFNNIRFDIGNALGGTYTGIALSYAWGWKFDNYRLELVAGTNVRFCNLDLAANKVKGLVFNPLFETYTATANIAVNLLNATQGTLSYPDIYVMNGVVKNNNMQLIYTDNGFGKRYRKPTTDYNLIEQQYLFGVDHVLLANSATGEIYQDYGASDQLKINGVRITTANPAVLYLKNIIAGDSFKVMLKVASPSASPLISFKTWDVDDVLIDSNEVVDTGVTYKALCASNMYWDTTNKRLLQSVANSEQVFTVNRNEVKTIAVLFSGDLNGIEIFASRTLVSVLKSIDPLRNNAKHHVQAAAPTLDIAGYYLPGDIVYNSNTASGQHIGWILIDTSFAGSGTLAWVSLGKYT